MPFLEPQQCANDREVSVFFGPGSSADQQEADASSTRVLLRQKAEISKPHPWNNPPHPKYPIEQVSIPWFSHAR
eukprot:2386507-Amphidinium_carterae.1